ncbi:SDR family oxidoreductase [Nocardia macrotermitis]|uniref:3-phenylpropionate-dihydrodiol/cinnamic acid-dihydrodiol dehydrogenase n=1 Tax=Nocardia macrotermitis TaxID=2585198 RepID=A0A7K0DD06_9NOCA|nr:SDR family oxidoreductase [Nocardia macrotermitis]MQY23401.1 3-phenylpropionate-dihydrodiol/cinnamic acid-dihydrodiol dehydrogenase [Nocardia macrotermitis]
MDVSGKVAIVTGAGAGIGAALARGLAGAGAKVVLADLAVAVVEVGAELGERAVSVVGDVTDVAVIRELVARAESEFGPVDLYFANAGIFGARGLDGSDEQWAAAMEVNVMAHVRAAQVLIPGWEQRGSGYFVVTASAAGLLTQIGSAPYAVTKHAAVGFAEWLNITYGDKGIRVSCVCPMGVDTDLLRAGNEDFTEAAANEEAIRAVVAAGEVLTPEQVAADILSGVADERFLILPHAQVLEMYRHKSADYDRWLAGMRRYQATLQR